MLESVDYLLDRLTMYRLVFYYLLVLVAAATVFSWFNVLHFSALHVVASAAYIFVVCWMTNKIFAWGFDVPANIESTYITALILALIITPLHVPHDLLFLTAASGLAISSKYILTIRGRHIFNPAALAVALTALGAHQTASWWVGTSAMAPLVLTGGLLVVRKLRCSGMVASFLAAAIVSTAALNLMHHASLTANLKSTLLHSSLLFLAFVMLTEPRTSPSTTKRKIIYGALVGLLFPPQMHLGSLYSTPELALLAGNVFAYLVTTSPNLLPRFNSREITAPDSLDFVFTPDRPVQYQPGQYMEWTLPHQNTDSRGNRRYFTLASSPTEKDLRIGVKFYDKGSSFKRAMINLDHAVPISAGHLGGDFVLPSDQSQKLAFIAGGIGVTPFRSMVKYLVDKDQRRDITLLYSEKNPRQFAYRSVFRQARHQLGIKTLYTLSEPSAVPGDWSGETGRISAALIKKTIPDYRERTFYVAGPQPMVKRVKRSLLTLGVPHRQIKTDFFPGYA